ncbi:MAG: DUF6602 domain-containing protein [Pirellulales bacterium]
MVQSDVRGYLQSWADELVSRADRVRLLIGDAHWLSDGHHKEYLLRDFLHRHLPPGLSIVRGFVRPPDDNVPCSPENDILISDPARHAPFFNEGGLVIVPPSSVVAFVEAKTTLTKQKVVEAIISQAATHRTIETYVPSACAIWRGIVFAATSPKASLDTSLTTIINAIGDVRSKDNLFTVSCLPKCISTYNRFFFLVSSTDNDSYRIRGFDLGRLSIACFFSELASGIAALYQRHRPNPELGDAIASISTGQLCRDIRLAEQQESEEHDYD